MPVTLAVPIRRLSQAEFGEFSYEVMRHVFAIHNDLGRFFDEAIYKSELRVESEACSWRSRSTLPAARFMLGTGSTCSFEIARSSSSRPSNRSRRGTVRNS